MLQHAASLTHAAANLQLWQMLRNAVLVKNGCVADHIV
jgi:hypothetical protein